MSPKEFLTAELSHAERQLARVRRLAAQMQADLEAAGLTEVAVYEKLANHKAYRQLQRDQVIFQQTWLRVHRHLLRLPHPAEHQQAEQHEAEPSPGIPVDDLLASLRTTAAAPLKPQPYRKPPTPGPNERCPCHSGLKYKRCCGSPLRKAA